MTEKRFGVINISKNGMKGLFQLGNDNLSVYDVARLVNELLEENEQLKSKNRGLQSELQIFKEDVTHSNQIINKLNDENEQLKKELKALRKKYNDFSDTVDKRLKELKIE